MDAPKFHPRQICSLRGLAESSQEECVSDCQADVWINTLVVLLLSVCKNFLGFYMYLDFSYAKTCF
jgi:hypothetical protein